MVSPYLVIRARLLQHLVEDGSLRGALRLFALDHGDEVVVNGLVLVLLRLLLLVVVLLGSSARAFVIVSLGLSISIN